MKAKKKNSIFFKTQAYLVTFCLVLLLLLWIFEISFFAYFYRNYQMQTVNDIASAIDKNNIYTVYDEIENKAYENNVCILLFNDFGEIKEFNTKMNGCKIKNTNVKKIIYQFLNSDKERLTQIIKDKDNKKGFIYALKNDGIDIFIYSPLEDHSMVNTLMKNQLFYVMIVTILLSIAISFYLSNVITRPIRKITKNAINIGKENYHNDFKETGILEIDELNIALDDAQKELAKVQTYQKDLLANVSHDLKTPLTMIKAYAEKIRDISYKDKEKLESDTNVIISEADRLTILVNDILTLSKAQNDAFLELQKYDLVPEINEILKRYDIIRETEKYDFIVDLPKEAIIKADKHKINQVIYNLINNAINYTGDDKKVYISLKKENKDYVFEVRDTGKGIKKSEIKNIWTKYYKNDKNHKRNVVSTGIGLSIVKEVLEKHNFKYGVISEEKAGSVFFFKAPISKNIKSKNKEKEN